MREEGIVYYIIYYITVHRKGCTGIFFFNWSVLNQYCRIAQRMLNVSFYLMDVLRNGANRGKKSSIRGYKFAFLIW